jgi:hypothetical protein
VEGQQVASPRKEWWKPWFLDVGDGVKQVLFLAQPTQWWWRLGGSLDCWWYDKVVWALPASDVQLLVVNDLNPVLGYPDGMSLNAASPSHRSFSVGAILPPQGECLVTSANIFACHN